MHWMEFLTHIENIHELQGWNFEYFLITLKLGDFNEIEKPTPQK